MKSAAIYDAFFLNHIEGEVRVNMSFCKELNIFHEVRGIDENRDCWRGRWGLRASNQIG